MLVWWIWESVVQFLLEDDLVPGWSKMVCASSVSFRFSDPKVVHYITSIVAKSMNAVTAAKEPWCIEFNKTLKQALHSSESDAILFNTCSVPAPYTYLH